VPGGHACGIRQGMDANPSVGNMQSTVSIVFPASLL
jgi:hypothetical protein